MPSRALGIWDGDRVPRLALVDGQLASVADPRLTEENLRAFVVLLSAHFQGFCRDLYTEAAQVIASKVRKSLRLVVQDQFVAQLKLDRGNPTLANIFDDFGRLGFDAKVALHAALGADAGWHHRLHNLNEWRNAVAHDLKAPKTPPLNVTSIRLWQDTCDRIARALDSIVYHGLQRLLRRTPWLA